MYGHADSVLTPCADCPTWEPQWARALSETDNRPLCLAHYMKEMA